MSPDHATVVRVLCAEGCPGSEASAGVLREVLSRPVPGTEIEMVELSSRAFSELGTAGRAPPSS